VNLKYCYEADLARKPTCFVLIRETINRQFKNVSQTLGKGKKETHFANHFKLSAND